MNITIIAGSNRAESTGTRLCRYMAKLIIEGGHSVTLVDLYATPIPFYSPDHVSDDPNLLLMKKAASEAEAIVLSTPEYHAGVSGVIKNALDHLGGEYFDGKAVLSVSSAGGNTGTASLQQLHMMVRNLHGINCPEWISIGGGSRSFNEAGEPDDLHTRERVVHVLNYFLRLSARLAK